MGKKRRLKFEEALERLERIVGDIEQGTIGLEESLERYGEGMDLIRHCRSILSNAEKKIEILSLSTEGRVEGSVADEKTLGLTTDSSESKGDPSRPE
jgi:exodeoxyribonuclease VII small subunit